MSIDPLTHPRCVRCERTIHAPIDLVWSVLSDFERYPEWNPFTYGVTCDRVVGHEVLLKVNLGRGRLTMHEKLSRYEEGAALAWGVEWGGGFLLASDRVQTLEKGDGPDTIYRCFEAFDGLLAPIVYRFYGAPVGAGFEACAEALQKRCEGL